MIKGIDVSHWQGGIDWKKVSVDFVFIKCSGGDGGLYVDSRFSVNKDGARAKGIALGYYHFAGAGDPVKEADHFLKSVGDIVEGEMLVLDWEVPHKDPVGWCKTFLDRVSAAVGFKPLLYTNEARVVSLDWTPVVKADYGLWVAKYGDNDDKAESNETPKTGKWPFAVIWQYSSTGSVQGISGRVDLNIADTDVETLKKYGKPLTAEVMNKDFIKAIELLTDKEYGDNLNENEQKDAAKRIKEFVDEREELISDFSDTNWEVAKLRDELSKKPIEVIKEVQDPKLVQELTDTKKALEEQKALVEKNAGDTGIIEAIVFVLKAIKARL